VTAVDSLRIVVRSGLLLRRSPRCHRVSRGTGSVMSFGRRGPERERRTEAEGKIKGRGTVWRERVVCTWGRRGTRRIAAWCRVRARCACQERCHGAAA
jgi:hypothetical protein